jgi:DNA polymerase III alpha subunit
LVEKYFKKLEEGMLAKGYSMEDVEYFVDYCKQFLGYSFNAAHSCAYAYTAMQTLYLKTYYPAYFFANLLNYEAHENYQTIAADALANGIEILPPSITQSKYEFSVEGNKIRIGLMAIKGCGEKAVAELQELKLNECKTIDQILTKPLKKVNSKVLTVLVDAGAFDDLGIDREKILIARTLYKEKKIQTWFTRKSKPLDISTMPETLLQFPEHIVFALVEEHKHKEEPWISFVTGLIPHIPSKGALSEKKKDELAEELLGISLVTAKKLSKLWELATQYPELNLKSLGTRSADSDLCYWFLKEVTKAKTKNGKPYLTLNISDGSISVRAKCWRVQEFKKGSTYISQLKKDMYGYTVIQNNMLEEIDVDK